MTLSAHHETKLYKIEVLPKGLMDTEDNLCEVDK